MRLSPLRDALAGVISLMQLTNGVLRCKNRRLSQNSGKTELLKTQSKDSFPNRQFKLRCSTHDMIARMVVSAILPSFASKCSRNSGKRCMVSILGKLKLPLRLCSNDSNCNPMLLSKPKWSLLFQIETQPGNLKHNKKTKNQSKMLKLIRTGDMVAGGGAMVAIKPHKWST